MLKNNVTRHPLPLWSIQTIQLLACVENLNLSTDTFEPEYIFNNRCNTVIVAQYSV